VPLSVAPFVQAGLSLELAEFETLVMAAVTQILPRRPLVDARVELTPAELSFLQAAGVTPAELAPPELGTSGPLIQTAADYAALLAAALTVPELATRLGVDQSRVRQRIAQHTVIALKVGATWRLPLFQLDDGGEHLVPGLSQVAPRLAGLHPVLIARWFTLPHVDLSDAADTSLSPRAWLLGGGDPTEVAALADELRTRA
jgi:excisionase family DNA binding protein